MTGPALATASADAYRSYDRTIDRTVSFRPVTMERDCRRLHAWLGYDHVKPYWQLDEPLPAFRDALAAKLEDDHLTPYVGRLDDVPMSYWECYWAAEDDVAAHYDAAPADQGVHLLIGPPAYLGRGYAEPLLRAIVAMQFRHPETERVIAEPDARNDRAIHVFEQCGFEPRETFHFPEAGKDAQLLVCDRERFADVVKRADAAHVPAPAAGTQPAEGADAGERMDAGDAGEQRDAGDAGEQRDAGDAGEQRDAGDLEGAAR